MNRSSGLVQFGAVVSVDGRPDELGSVREPAIELGEGQRPGTEDVGWGGRGQQVRLVGFGAIR
jgi:hypothetical protein